MARRWASKGFTIVELLIVIVVIAILAAVTIVAFNGVQTRAKNAQMISAVGVYVKAIRVYTEQEGVVPMSGTGLLCFEGRACWIGANVEASQTFRENLGKAISTHPTFPSGAVALITRNTTTDSINGGSYTGWYVLYQMGGSTCASIGGLRYLNHTTGSDSLISCRAALEL